MKHSVLMLMIFFDNHDYDDDTDADTDNDTGDDTGDNINTHIIVRCGSPAGHLAGHLAGYPAGYSLLEALAALWARGGRVLLRTSRYAGAKCDEGCPRRPINRIEWGPLAPPLIQGLRIYK